MALEIGAGLMRCVDCPDMPNGTRKRLICCQREGAVITEAAPDRAEPEKGRVARIVRAKHEIVEVKRKLKIGDVVPMPKRKLEVKPAFTPGTNASSFKPARGPRRLGK